MKKRKGTANLTSQANKSKKRRSTTTDFTDDTD